MKRGIIKWILLSIVSIWIVISVFFYFQHRIQVDMYPIGKYIEFDDFSILIKNVEKYNYENNKPNYKSSRAIMKLNLPWNITETILKTKYFYNRPYSSNKGYQYSVNCEIIYNPNSVSQEKVVEIVNEKINLEVCNKSLQSFDIHGENGMQYTNKSNIIHYEKIGDWKNDSTNLKISDLENDHQYIIPLEKASTGKYDYFNRKKEDKSHMADNIIDRFLRSYKDDDIKSAETYINNKYVDDFPWDRIKQYEYETILNAHYELSYIGEYKEEKDVFLMKVSFDENDNSMKKINFYLVYKDFNWQIIDIV
ncbi:hypothetical protein [Anaerovorax odorimutans]|uniref:hypothetical protein n=1 Tax=Anaerovorax odorimutans TaxID=109327 RepID=UPI0004161310|nr:hypothetical protein [Anaerovorax odorimutans]